MPIGVIHESPGGTQDQYEQVAARLTDGRGLGSPDDWPVLVPLLEEAGISGEPQVFPLHNFIK